ncbi:M14-type cytosolic carboxypeptidase [Emticicia sediminis]
MNKIFSFLLLVCCFLDVFSQTIKPKFEGQAAISEKVDTRNHAIIPQWRGKQTLGGITFDNNFEGARLNGITQNNDTLYTAIIAAENYPINPSPWYAFKVTAKIPRTIWVNLTYLNAKHRYYPKISRDGKTWKLVDSTDCVLIKDPEAKNRTFQENALSESAFVRINVDEKTTWIAAQELMTSSIVNKWSKEILKNKFVSTEIIGKSPQNRPFQCLRIGEDKTDSKIMIVIGRLHPPEVTGQFALQAFVEALCMDAETAKKFRKEYTVYVVPMMNPDGVDNGHWRHNTGGIDLNRDWADFNQPETQFIRDFLRKKIDGTQSKLYFGIDFHSTWDDIFYTNLTEKPTNMEGLIKRWFEALEQAIPDYKVNARGSKPASGVISKAFFNKEFNAEALVYEVGDNTSRDFTILKSKTAAEKLMLLSLEYLKEK